jgi:hypothetical protein
MERAVDAPGCYRLKDETEISALLQSAETMTGWIQTFHIWEWIPIDITALETRRDHLSWRRIVALFQSAKQIVRSIQTFHVWLPSLAASRLESCGMSGNERNSLSHGEGAWGFGKM